MVSLASLWIPILLSAVLVFVASSVIHMVLRYHRTDFGPLPQEPQVLDAVRPFSLPEGEYSFPFAQDMKEMGTPGYQEKLAHGPVGYLTILPNGPFTMGKSLVLWFLYSVVVSIFAAYITGRAVGPGAEYMDVFQFTSTTAFLGYAVALWQNSIWYKRSWAVTAKNTFDGLVYALVTAGVFGWLWPGPA